MWSSVPIRRRTSDARPSRKTVHVAACGTVARLARIRLTYVARSYQATSVQLAEPEKAEWLESSAMFVVYRRESPVDNQMDRGRPPMCTFAEGSVLCIRVSTRPLLEQCLIGSQRCVVVGHACVQPSDTAPDSCAELYGP